MPPGGTCAKTADCAGTGFKCNTKTLVCDCAANTPDTCGADQDAVCTQKMTDPENCGECGTMCEPGAACVAGKCGTKPTLVATATGCGGGARLDTDGKNIYWVEPMTGKVRSVGVGGGTIADVATGQLKPTQIGVDASGVHWVNQGDGSAGSSKVLKKRLNAAATAAPTALVTATGMQTFPAIAVHDGFVYYSESTNVHQLTVDDDDKVTKDIMVGIAVNYDNGGMEVKGVPVGLAASDKYVLWTTPLDRIGVESHTLVPVTNATDNKPGYGKLGKSVAGLLPTGHVALDATYGYWVGGTKIERAPLTSTMGVYDAIFSAERDLTAFALGASKLYAASGDGKILTHSPIPPVDPANETEPAVPIAIGQEDVSSVVVDTKNVYWITGDCAIMSQPL